ncbi:LysR substrate-binding domain-containing protein [Dactylosporangium sp. NPDC049525]|uniref:LysR substrate-binding domain-containing protein n=1 Tax=Dactylosporangium sp. NPDC049525 TaxID=3154730 RepID=UPI0034190324
MTLPELRQLRYFVAVAERLSFSAAARDLHLAQQSLSQQLARLERTLGVRLFDRDQRGTRLTEPGRVFLAEARAVLERTEAAVASVRQVPSRLHLAFLASVGNYMLPAVVRVCRERLPGVELSTTDGSIERVVAGLRAGEFQVAFTRPPLVPDLRTRTLLREPACAVLPQEHRLAGRAELGLDELAAEPWVLTPRASWPPWHDKYDQEFASAGFAPDVVQRADTVPGLLGLVAAGVGVSRLARSARSIRRTGVVFVPLRGEHADTVAAWRDPDPMVEALVAAVAELARTTDLTAAG